MPRSGQRLVTATAGAGTPLSLLITVHSREWLRTSTQRRQHREDLTKCLFAHQNTQVSVSGTYRRIEKRHNSKLKNKYGTSPRSDSPTVSSVQWCLSGAVLRDNDSSYLAVYHTWSRPRPDDNHIRKTIGKLRKYVQCERYEEQKQYSHSQMISNVYQVSSIYFTSIKISIYFTAISIALSSIAFYLFYCNRQLSPYSHFWRKTPSIYFKKYCYHGNTVLPPLFPIAIIPPSPATSPTKHIIISLYRIENGFAVAGISLPYSADDP